MDRDAIRRLGANCGREMRRKAERLINRARLKKDTVILTGLNRVNKITRTDQTSLVLAAEQGQAQITVNRSCLVAAVAYMYRVRHVGRKELEAFHRFNSAMFGLLKTVFRKEARMVIRKRSLRLVMTGLRFFLSGAERCVRDLYAAVLAGAKYVLFSYYYLRNRKSWLKHTERLGLRILLDSGAFSLWQAKQKGKEVEDITLDEYVAFIHKYEHLLEGYVCLDVVGDYQATKDNQAQMEALGLSPIPVYHLGTPVTELHHLVESGYPVIALGGTVNAGKPAIRIFLEEVFSLYPDQPFHGLGISDSNLITTFAFFSCDSRVWQIGRQKNIVLTAGGQVRGDKDAPLAERMNSLAKCVRFLVDLEEPETIIRLKNPVSYQLVLNL